MSTIVAVAHDVTPPGPDTGAVRFIHRHGPERGLDRADQAAPAQPRGNRKLNHAMHVAAVTLIRHDSRVTATTNKLAKRRSNTAVLPALKCRISDPVWRQPHVDLGR